MKPLYMILALATAALAAPTAGGGGGACKPATYGCAVNAQTGAQGWKVCDVLGNWVYAGDCPPNTQCYFLQANGSPYCLPCDP